MASRKTSKNEGVKWTCERGSYYAYIRSSDSLWKSCLFRTEWPDSYLVSVERNDIPVVTPFYVRIAEHPNTRAAIAEAKARAEEVLETGGCRVLENIGAEAYYRLLKTVDRTVRLPRTITSKHGVVLTLSSDGKRYRGTAIGEAPVYDIEIDVSRPQGNYEAVAKRNGVTVDRGKGWRDDPPEERLEIALNNLESGLKFPDYLGIPSSCYFL